MLRCFARLLATLGLFTSLDAAAEALPRPQGLEPNVRFWTRIYTEVDTHAGLIHDSDRLDVVYESLRFPDDISARERERRVDDAKRHYEAILMQLATGQHSGLSSEAERVLALWPAGTSNETLRAAASNVRFQLGQADKFRAGLVRASQWRAHIERVLAEEGVPSELVALPHVESSFNPRAYSHVGAAGLWQFMRSTGRRYMRVDEVVDERMDPHKASVAAAQLLGYNFRQIESWPLAITAYNHGLAGMVRAAQTLGTRDIATIVARYQSRSFGFASRNFYAEFLAASAIDRDPERYFGHLEPQPEIEYEVVKLDHFYRIGSLQRALGIDLDSLREHNLALRPPVWNGAKYVPRGYELRVPKRAASQPLEQLIASIPPDQRLADQHRDRFYKVRRGDTLPKIASRQGISEDDLRELNNLRARGSLHMGQVLRLPDHASAPAPVVVASVERAPADRVHRVRRGETLTSIAQHYGVTEAEIAATNDLRSRNAITVGQRLRLPGEAETPAEPKAAAQTMVVVAAAKPVATPPPADASRPPAPTPTPAPAPEASAPAPQAAEAPPSAAAAPPGARASAAEVHPSAPSPAPPPAPPSVPEARPSQGPETPPPSAPAPTAIASVATAVAPPALAAAKAPAPAATPAPAPEAAREAAPESEAATPPAPDPSNYAVSSDHRITVQADETLGHYAEWLEVRPNALRRLNKMKPGTPVQIGHDAKLDFSHVTPEVFEQRRLEYHVALQEAFFEAYVVSGTEAHVLKKGETLWFLAQHKFDVPVWLLRQYNPDLDFSALRPGTRMVIPVIEPREGGA
jgi:membrane-bound lytic murein transglycosylase D